MKNCLTNSDPVPGAAKMQRSEMTADTDIQGRPLAAARRAASGVAAAMAIKC
jgi:hypothetical protein